MPIDQLIEKMRAGNAPADEASEAGSRIGELIALAREAAPDRDGFEIAVGDVVARIEFVQLAGARWCDLTAVSPPRKGSTHDFAVGYDSHAVVRNYPVESAWVNGETVPTVLVDGEPVAAEVWAEFAGLLDGPALEDAATVLWVIHESKPRARRAEVVKAKGAGQ
ncbi:hypothetical protein [Microbacterium sulfonylureivorans]|uniref:hypothetical protein n=1 Tax=Microbacterium sulfonylureivorans TaxID=2486854 RepID=UPI000FD931C4|nr:hypothetical protein [Microbacterium sulfonylureivorans]